MRRPSHDRNSTRRSSSAKDNKRVATEGYIIFVDIVSYSTKPADEQFECATYLTKKAQKTRFFQRCSQRGSFLHANTTGDGFVLVCGGTLVSTEPYRLLDFTHEMLEASKKFNLVKKYERFSRLEIRCGIHKGKFFFKCPAFNDKTALGTGVNMAARICGLADAGQVIVSRDFREDYSNHRTKDSKSSLREFSKYWSARVKHNLSIPVCQYRFLRAHDNSIEYGTGSKPRAQKAHESVHQLVSDQLKFIITELGAHLETKGIPQAHSRLRARLLYPNHDTNTIQPTLEFFAKFDETNQGTSAAVFSIRDDRPTGVPGFAYVRHQAIAHTDLPDPNLALNEYLSAFLQFNLNSEEMKSMLGRKARAFLSLPIACPLFDDCIVLSIDSRHPLYPVSSVETMDLLDRLRRISKPLIAPAWDLWCKV